MTRGNLRFDEAQYKAYMARQSFKRANDQRPSAPEPTALPSSAAGSGGALTYTEIIANGRRKYGNKPTNGYASIKESKRAFQLKLMQEAGQIRNLREQVSYLLIPKQHGERACYYRSDFDYEEWTFAPGKPVVTGPSDRYEWVPVVEDCKGMRTDVYRLKRKLMKFVHGISIRET